MLEKIRVPGFLLEFISLVYRMIFLLEQSRATIWKTQELRQGYDGWRNSMRSLAMLSSSLFIRSHLRAAKLNLGLESRGYEHSLAVQRFSDVPMNTIAVCCAIFVPLLVGFVSFWIAAS
jgi:cobalt/nickel transport system permease protein